MKIARVATDAALGRLFDYAIPPELSDKVYPGVLVRVRFRARTIECFVIELAEKSEVDGSRLKPIEGVASGRPLVSSVLLQLAKWMAAYYLAPIERCLKCMFPPVVRGGVAKDHFRHRLMVRARKPGEAVEPMERLDEKPETALDLFSYAKSKKNPEKPRQRKPGRAVEGTSGAVLRPTIRQQEILDRLGDTEQTVKGFCDAWHFSPATIRRMALDGWLVLEEKIDLRNPLEKVAKDIKDGRILKSKPLPLNEEQAAALAAIREELAFCPALDACPGETRAAKNPERSAKPLLLHGVTASGKTEVFLQAISDVLQRGGGAIVLVPEISLTAQTIRRFASRFGNTIAVLHSQLTDGQRHDEWQRIRCGEARVVIGPRSAIFAPIDRLGIIVVDEEQEPSYKQDEVPRYQGRDVGVMRARFERCPIVLASATPSLESWNNAQTGKYRLLTLRSRAVSQEMPHTVLVDMKSEVVRNGGKCPLFSETLVQSIQRCLETQEQVMLFLNRRGFAPTVSCPKCGYVAMCDTCSVGMTYHKDDRVMRCHICGAYRDLPQECPNCRERVDFKTTGFGTQRVEEIARNFFPHARIERMDMDVTMRKDSHDEILGRFQRHETDILIGTQMIAKGLDFSNVTLAGILNADTGLNMPDFRASERTFQLIAQMAGRVGRGVKPGNVIVQTFQPEAPAIVRAQTEDYLGFARDELAIRKELRYPPFSHLVCVTFRGEDERETVACAEQFAAAIGQPPDGAYILGAPAPACIERMKGQWRYQLTLRGEKPLILFERLRAAIAACPRRSSVLMQMDIDAVSLL
ncbi:MAG: primosomal protein N' [Kiritimatiellia bacterium]